MAFHEIQGARLFSHFVDSGRSSTLVFSNSLGADHRMWDPQVESLSSHFNLLCYDTRGHGQSEVTPGEYDVALLGRDVVGLLDAHGLQKVVFCGLSMGGLIGQWLLRHAGDRLQGLVLCNTATKIGSEQSWNERIAQVRSGGLTPLLEATGSRWFTAAFRQSHPERVQAVLNGFAQTSPAGYAANCAAVRDADFRQQPVGEREIATLVVSGRHDAVTTVEHGWELANSLPGARHEILEAAHLSNVEAAEALNALLVEFSHTLNSEEPQSGLRPSQS